MKDGISSIPVVQMLCNMGRFIRPRMRGLRTDAAFAAYRSGAVQARGFMVNPNDSADMKKPQ